MAEDTLKYVDAHHLPTANFKIKEPRNMSGNEIRAFFYHIVERQRTFDISEVFRIKHAHKGRKASVGGCSTAGEDNTGDPTEPNARNMALNSEDTTGGSGNGQVENTAVPSADTGAVVGTGAAPPTPTPRPKPKRKAKPKKSTTTLATGAAPEIGITSEAPPQRPKPKPKGKKKTTTVQAGAAPETGITSEPPTQGPKPKPKGKKKTMTVAPGAASATGTAPETGTALEPPRPRPRPRPITKGNNNNTTLNTTGTGTVAHADELQTGESTVGQRGSITTNDLIDPYLIGLAQGNLNVIDHSLTGPSQPVVSSRAQVNTADNLALQEANKFLVSGKRVPKKRV